MAAINFNASQVAPDTGRGDPLPQGWYDVAMVQSEMKPTSAGDGAFLQCVFDVVSGPFQGRKLFSRFNLRNNNAQAQEIAYKQFSAVCHAVGHLQVGDTSELHGRPLKVRVKVRPAEGQYEASNDITKYDNINAQVAVPVQAAALPPQTPALPPAMPPQQTAWGPPSMPVQPPAMPPQPAWTPPAMQPAPAAVSPQAVPQFWQPPATPPQAPQYAPPEQSAPPAWQPPAGAVAQPWAQQPAQQAAPPQAPQLPPQAPVGQPAPWSPAPAGVAQPAAAIPPWAVPKG